MNREYVRQVPVIRLVFVVAAFVTTLSLASFIDLLASPQITNAEQVRLVITASWS